MVSDFMGGKHCMITLQQLQCGYHGRALHTPITHQFNAGALTAVIGANGSGKTTLFNTICGLIAPVAGSVSISGAISYLPQQAAIDRSFPISVVDVITMGTWPNNSLVAANKADTDSDVQQIMAQLQIDAYAHLSIDKLSGGQFQRMLFARLLVQDAQILLLDEPFNGIDGDTQATLLTLIKQLHQQGKTIIAVLHDVEMVKHHFPELLWLQHGQCVIGSSSRLLASNLSSTRLTSDNFTL